MKTDLNADLGESYGNYSLGNDDIMLDYVSSANIACGFHAGDPVVIRDTIRKALEKGVAIGAHPAYPDIAGFGRRKMIMSRDEIYCSVLYQIGALKSICESLGGKMQHVKPHGALYHSAGSENEVALAIVEAVSDLDNDLIIFGQSGSELEAQSNRHKIKFKSEVFADRAYNNDGTLVSRSEKGSCIGDENEIAGRAIEMVKLSRVKSISGKSIEVKADTICLHGDNENAIAFAKKLHRAFSDEGIQICSFMD